MNFRHEGRLNSQRQVKIPHIQAACPAVTTSWTHSNYIKLGKTSWIDSRHTAIFEPKILQEGGKRYQSSFIAAKKVFF